jgi:hypothetical protein
MKGGINGLLLLCSAAIAAATVVASKDTQAAAAEFVNKERHTAETVRGSDSILHRNHRQRAVTVGANRNCSFQVYPVKGAIFQARTALRNALAAYRQHPGAADTYNDIVMCLYPGAYDVSRETLSFTEIDSVPAGGQIRITWRSVVPGAAVISGGVQLTGWYPVTLGGGAAYAVSIPTGTFAAGMPVRQLWINGVRSARTVVGDVSSSLGGMKLWTSSGAIGFTTGKAVPSSWLNNTHAIEFTWPIVIANWISPRCTIASIDVATNNITLTNPCGALLFDRANAKTGTLPPPVTAEVRPTPYAHMSFHPL